MLLLSPACPSSLYLSLLLLLQLLLLLVVGVSVTVPYVVSIGSLFTSQVEKRRQKNVASEEHAEAGVLFIKNLNFQTTEETLERHFAPITGHPEETIICR